MPTINNTCRYTHDPERYLKRRTHQLKNMMICTSPTQEYQSCPSLTEHQGGIASPGARSQPGVACRERPDSNSKSKSSRRGQENQRGCREWQRPNPQWIRKKERRRRPHLEVVRCIHFLKASFHQSKLTNQYLISL